MSKAQYLLGLQSHFVSVAPHHLAQSCQVLSLQAGTLSIAVGNATVAAKLRQLAPELVNLLQNRGCEVSGIRVKVQVAVSYSQPGRPPRKLSKTARSTLNELKDSMNESPLKLALEKIIKT